MTFGADTTISGRALAGSTSGAITLATIVSAVTGFPPIGYPAPIVVANTVTDASGNYVFERVEPSTNLVRWDLSGAATGLYITAANQGDDDTLDSDGVSGEAGGFVHTMNLEILAGTIHPGVDLGLVEILFKDGFENIPGIRLNPLAKAPLR